MAATSWNTLGWDGRAGGKKKTWKKTPVGFTEANEEHSHNFLPFPPPSLSHTTCLGWMVSEEGIPVKPTIKLEAGRKVGGDASSGDEKGATDHPSKAAKSEPREDGSFRASSFIPSPTAPRVRSRNPSRLRLRFSSLETLLASAVTCKYRLGGGERHSRRRGSLAVGLGAPRFVCSLPPPPSRGLRRAARGRSRSRAPQPLSLFPANSCSKRAAGFSRSFWPLPSGSLRARRRRVCVCVSNQQAPKLELKRRKGERVREKPHKREKRRGRKSRIRQYKRVPAGSPLDPSSGSQTE